MNIQVLSDYLVYKNYSGDSCCLFYYFIEKVDGGGEEAHQFLAFQLILGQVAFYLFAYCYKQTDCCVEDLSGKYGEQALFPTNVSSCFGQLEEADLFFLLLLTGRW